MCTHFCTLGDLPALRAIADAAGVPRCRKHRHQSRAAALAQIRSIARRDRDSRPADRFRPYQCPACSAFYGESWHVGHVEEGR